MSCIVQSTVSLKNFILNNYTVVGISKDVTPEECDTFLLAEDHSDETIRQINGLFISLFATPGSALLIEGEDFLAPIRLETLTRKQFYIDTPHIHQILGWDIKDYHELIEAPRLAQQTAILINKRKYSPLTDIDWEKMMLELFETHIKGQNAGQELQAYAAGVEKQIKCLAGRIREFEEENIKPLQNRLKEADRLCNQEEDLLKKSEYMKESMLASMALYKAVEERTDFILDAYDSTPFFPKRTEAMVATLDKMCSMLSSNGKTFLIGGLGHLEEGHHRRDEEAALYSLKPLQDYVQNHKKIVILKPKNSQ